MPIIKNSYGKNVHYFQFVSIRNCSDHFYFFDKDKNSRQEALQKARDYRRMANEFRIWGKESFKLAKLKWRRWIKVRPSLSRRQRIFNRRQMGIHSVEAGNPTIFQIEAQLENHEEADEAEEELDCCITFT